MPHLNISGRIVPVIDLREVPKHEDVGVLHALRQKDPIVVRGNTSPASGLRS